MILPIRGLDCAWPWIRSDVARFHSKPIQWKHLFQRDIKTDRSIGFRRECQYYFGPMVLRRNNLYGNDRRLKWAARRSVFYRPARPDVQLRLERFKFSVFLVRATLTLLPIRSLGQTFNRPRRWAGVAECQQQSCGWLNVLQLNGSLNCCCAQLDGSGMALFLRERRPNRLRDICKQWWNTNHS